MYNSYAEVLSLRSIPQIPLEDNVFNFIKEVKYNSRLSWRDFIIKVVKYYNENKDNCNDNGKTNSYNLKGDK